MGQSRGYFKHTFRIFLKVFKKKRGMGNGASADVSNDTCYDILEFEKNRAFFLVICMLDFM